MKLQFPVFLLFLATLIGSCKTTGERFASAVEMGQVSEVQTLLREEKLDLNREDFPFEPFVKYRLPVTALEQAVQQGKIELIQLLLENGAIVHKRCMMTAVQRGNLEVLQLLLDRGGKLNADTLTAAIDARNLVSIEFNLSHGVSAETKHLQQAIRSRRRDIAKLLIERGIKGEKFTSLAVCQALAWQDLSILEAITKLTQREAPVENCFFKRDVDTRSSDEIPLLLTGFRYPQNRYDRSLNVIRPDESFYPVYSSYKKVSSEVHMDPSAQLAILKAWQRYAMTFGSRLAYDPPFFSQAERLLRPWNRSSDSFASLHSKYEELIQRESTSADREAGETERLRQNAEQQRIQIAKGAAVCSEQFRSCMTSCASYPSQSFQGRRCSNSCQCTQHNCLCNSGSREQCGAYNALTQQGLCVQ